MDNRTIDLRDPDDYIPFDEYKNLVQLYKERLKAKASDLQTYADSHCDCLTIKYGEPEHLGVKNPCITILKDGKYVMSFTDDDEAEKKVKEMIDNINKK